MVEIFFVGHVTTCRHRVELYSVRRGGAGVLSVRIVGGDDWAGRCKVAI